MGNQLRAAGLVVAAFCAACSFHCYPPEHPVPAGEADVAPPGVDQETYGKADEAGQACMVLGFLGCPEAKPEGQDCADTIRTLMEIGTFPRANVLCVRTSRSIVRVRTCDVACEK